MLLNVQPLPVVLSCHVMQKASTHITHWADHDGSHWDVPGTLFGTVTHQPLNTKHAWKAALANSTAPGQQPWT
jgi:hypothetical protein